jgi:hypothetical protein
VIASSVGMQSNVSPALVNYLAIWVGVAGGSFVSVLIGSSLWSIPVRKRAALQGTALSMPRISQYLAHDPTHASIDRSCQTVRCSNELNAARQPS